VERAGAIVVMGVTGAGKSTVGKALAERLGWRFCEGDLFHSEANIAKMSRGEPLDDADRAPWLAALNAALRAAADDGTPVVLACSALTERYRRRLVDGLHEVGFVYLHGPPPKLRERVLDRQDHFADPSILDSQLDLLEEPGPTNAVWIDFDQPVHDTVDEIIERLCKRR
jgi:carbohydrate kinase (thermoresistant glucokinase family)